MPNRSPAKLHRLTCRDRQPGASIAALPQQVEALRATVRDLRFIFLEARDDALIARFSETRRRHPMAVDGYTLEEAIQRERDALASVAELGHRVDTSDLHPNTLRAWVKVSTSCEARTPATGSSSPVGPISAGVAEAGTAALAGEGEEVGVAGTGVDEAGRVAMAGAASTGGGVTPVATSPAACVRTRPWLTA